MFEVDPKVFGPGTWITTHVYSLVCEQSGRKRDYRQFASYTYRMIHALPCGKCRRHAVRYLDRHAIPMSKLEGSIFRWTVDFHNSVNRRLKKPVVTEQQAREMFENTEVVLNDPVSGKVCTLNATPEAGEGGCEDKPLLDDT